MRKSMEERLRILTNLCEEYERALKNAPDGKLICVRQGKYTKWYVRTEMGIRYLPKKERELAQKLAQKKITEHMMLDARREMYAIRLFLSHAPRNETFYEERFGTGTGYEELIHLGKELLLPSGLKWSNEPFEQNVRYPENKIHRSPSGNLLRSKSEMMIDMLLYQRGIPYRYECLLNINGVAIYPDFTLLKESTGQEVIWEHFGMMDNAEYVQNYQMKMQHYLENGYVPGVNMIVTYETADAPLDIWRIEREIDWFQNL